MTSLNHNLFQDRGFAILPDAVSPDTVTELIAALDHISDGKGVRKRGTVYAMRNLMELVPEIHTLAHSETFAHYVDTILGSGHFPVRAILFDKTPDANWSVIWHQDLSIAVRERRDAPGFGPWSEKAGIIHVESPVSVLENMVTLRLHLDLCDADNGPLLVLPGTHRLGRLHSSRIAELRTEQADVSCPVPSGGLLIMRPLLLHASAKSVSPRHRRVIHIEYANAPLPYGLKWYTAGEKSAGVQIAPSAPNSGGNQN